jgi:hypothetical protein
MRAAATAARGAAFALAGMRCWWWWMPENGDRKRRHSGEGRERKHGKGCRRKVGAMKGHAGTT